MHTETRDLRHSIPLALALLAVMALSACGGGGGTDSSNSSSAAQSADTSQQQLDATIDPDTSSAPVVTETEPNNGPGQAQDPGAPPVIVTGSGNSANDVTDVFEFTADQDGTLSIVLDGFEPNDLDLKAETDAGASQTSASPTAPVEQVLLPVKAGDVVTVTVTAANTGGLDSDYQLSISYTVSTATAGGIGQGASWTVVDACIDGLRADFRIYDMDADLVWPSPSSRYSIDDGGFEIATVGCVEGHLLCYGASRPLTNDDVKWGVGLDREYGCLNCCTRCKVGSRPRATLTCN